jgi:hypothetical protein
VAGTAAALHVTTKNQVLHVKLLLLFNVMLDASATVELTLSLSSRLLRSFAACTAAAATDCTTQANVPLCLNKAQGKMKHK